MSDSRVTREYKLHGLSELIHLDKLMDECFMLKLKGNAFLVEKQ